MSEVFVIGHRNPDTDAICSAISYAEFKRRTGMPEAVAARCGDTNERIDFVLATFGVPPPKFIADVSPKVRDVMQAEVLSVKSDATAAEALSLMDAHDIRVLPVLDARALLGFPAARPAGGFVITAGSGAEHLIVAVDRVLGLRRIDEAALEPPPDDSRIGAVARCDGRDLWLLTAAGLAAEP